MNDIRQILSTPLMETFAVEGKAPNTMSAHNMAHDALTAACDGGTPDPLEAWALKAMLHTYDPETGGVAFHAEFARNPEFENES